MVGATHKLALRPLAIVSDLEFDLPIDAKLRKKHRSSVVSVARKKKAEEDSERRELEGLSSPAKKSRVEVRNAGAITSPAAAHSASHSLINAGCTVTSVLLYSKLLHIYQFHQHFSSKTF